MTLTRFKERLEETDSTVCAGAALPRKHVSLQRIKTASGMNYNQSSLLPQQVFSFLSVVFQVKRGDSDRCIVGRIVFVITVISALAYLGLDLTFTIYDVKSKKTKKSVTIAFFVFINTVLWCTLGVYANRLCRRLLQCVSFINSIRMHSKTLFKIPAVLLIALLATITIGIASYEAYGKFWDESQSVCPVIELNIWVCRSLFLVRLFQSLLVLLFNLCIAEAALSICRTHTIAVRRFVKALENDGKACETNHTDKLISRQYSVAKNLAELYLPEQCYGDELSEEEASLPDDSQGFPTSERTQLLINASANESTSYGSVRHRSSVSTNPDTDDQGISFGKPALVHQGSRRKIKIQKKSLQKRQKASVKVGPLDPRMLPIEDILFSYWKLASRMRYASRALQRWLATWVAFTILWLLKWVIAWVDTPATYCEVAQFVFPLIMLVVMCTAYGEANMECSRIVPSITPLPERLYTILTLKSLTVGMTVFEHILSYSDIVAVITGIVLALSSRLVLDELLPPEHKG